MAFTVRGSVYQDLQELGSLSEEVFSLAGLVGLLAALKLFKYLALNRKMSLLWLTVGKAAPELAAFLVGFLFLIGGYAWCAQMLYGTLLPEFHSYQSSFSSLLRYLLGDFAYADLTRTRPAVTGIFFASYVAIVTIMALNIIIAILGK
jgi:hypothetical protein